MALAREQYESIFREIAKGKSLGSQLEATGSGYSQFYKGLDDDKELSDCYARARRHQAESGQSRILDAVDRLFAGDLDPNAARVAIDALKWNAARMHPAVYGEKQQLEHSGSIEVRAVRLKKELPPIKNDG